MMHLEHPEIGGRIILKWGLKKLARFEGVD
jgi:hypothetical protein